MNVPDWIEALLWALAALLGGWRALRSPERSRRGWWLVTAITLLFAADKVLDVYSLLHAGGRAFAQLVDPEHELRGPNKHYRHVLLALGVLVFGGALWVVMRSEQRPGAGQLLCAAGLVLVAGIVAVRVAPALQDVVSHAVTKAAEAVAFVLVLGGAALGNPTRPPPPTLRDGFL